ncbi:MAG: STAS domain-containing protein [Gemmatimonadales bacterium]
MARPLLALRLPWAGGPLNVSTTQPHRRELQAPENLGLVTREAFREQANGLLDEMGAGRGELVVDMAPTRGIDSSGLSALVMVHRHATERRQQVVLRNVCPEIEFLLVLTKLDDLFHFSSDS